MLKKLMLITAIVFVLLIEQVSAINMPVVIRIGLRYGNTAADSVQLSSVGGFKLFEAELKDLVFTHTNDEAANTVIAKPGAQANSIELFKDGQDKPFDTYNGSKGSLTIYPVSGYVNFSGKQYRGGIMLKRSGANITVINLLTAEEYLYGVVPSEMSASWNMEALKAQAICARTYLISSGINRHKDNGFDLCADVHCQAYNGVLKEHPNTNDAVDQTKGEIVSYNNEPAQVFFFSSSGGYTEDVKNVWGSEFPYLVSREDKYEDTANIKSANWSFELTGEELKNSLKDYGINVGDITGVKIIEKTAAGRVQKLGVSGTSGNIVLEKERIRNVLDTKSRMFDLLAILKPISVINAAGVEKINPAELNIKTQTGNNNSIGDISIITQSGNVTYAGVADKYLISGKGYGHGVGMSQWGAKGMADNGIDYKAILLHYFPGTNLIKID